MNAFNLLPPRRRKRGVELPASGPFLGVAGGLVVILLAAFLYFSADHRANARQAELNQLSPGVAQWTSVATGYLAFTTAAQQQTDQLTGVRQLAASRFNWSRLLGQLAVLMPADAQLSSLQVTAPSGASSATTTSTGSAIQLSACASSQAAVAETMVQLRRISQVSSVTLSSSTDSGSTGTSSTSSGSTASCSLPVQFQLSLAFATPAAPATSSAAVAPAATTSAATTSAATTSASTGSTS